MPARPVSVVQHENQVKRFRPERLAATNRNDVRRFVYDWFTHFEHASSVDFYLEHLADKDLSLTFPGMAPLTSHEQFAAWYENLLAQTRWNFHDLSAIQIQPSAPGRYSVTFIVDWYGEVKANSTQLAGWQSRSDSPLYHHRVRQTWTLTAVSDERLVIEQLVVTSGDTPSPIGNTSSPIGDRPLPRSE